MRTGYLHACNTSLRLCSPLQEALALQGTLAENNICCNIFVHLLHHLIIRAMHSILAWQICIPRAGNCFRVILWLALFVDCFHSGLVRVLACPKTKIKIPKPWGFFRILFSRNFINLKVFARFRQPLKFVAPGQIRPLFTRNES